MCPIGRKVLGKTAREVALGKYFVIQSLGSRSNSRDRLVQSSGDSPVFPSKRASSMERLLESPRKDYLSPPPETFLETEVNLKVEGEKTVKNAAQRKDSVEVILQGGIL